MKAHATATLLLLLALPANSQTSDIGLLVLDLGGDGLRLSDIHYPVLFDTDGDGEPERTSWTAKGQSEAFLWLDRDGDGRVDHGGELIGGATPLPAGLPRAHTFDVLRAFDDPSLGGNGDGALSRHDRVWGQLRLWIDADHDGASAPDEIVVLSRWGIRRIPLTYETASDYDGGLNLHRRWGRLEVSRQASSGDGRQVRAIAMAEIFFDRAPGDDRPPAIRNTRLASAVPF